MTKTLKLYGKKFFGWENFFKEKVISLNANKIELDSKDWLLNCSDLKKINTICKKLKVHIISIKSNSVETIIASKSLRIEARLNSDNTQESKDHEVSNTNSKLIRKDKKTFLHIGTVRSGDDIYSEENLLILGDINPGGIASAKGDIKIWGRLLGIAHAGKLGNREATIGALHFRPVQLRIADKVARGPQEKPDLGMAEEARLVSDSIVIAPLEV